MAHMKSTSVWLRTESLAEGILTFVTDTPNLAPLTDAQTTKLRQLTLLSLASTPTPLTYANLLSAFSLASASSLESLITSAIYANLLTARLSPTSTPPTVHITSVAPLRDLRPLSLPSLLSVLSVWNERCDDVIASLSTQIDTIKADAARRKAVAKKQQDIIDAAVLATNTNPNDPLSGDAGSGRPIMRPQSGKAAMGGNHLKRDLEEQQEDDGYDDFIEDVSGGDELGNVNTGGGGMDLDEPSLGLVGSGNAKGSGGRGNKKKSRGKLHP